MYQTETIKRGQHFLKWRLSYFQVSLFTDLSCKKSQIFPLKTRPLILQLKPSVEPLERDAPLHFWYALKTSHREAPRTILLAFVCATYRSEERRKYISVPIFAAARCKLSPYFQFEEFVRKMAGRGRKRATRESNGRVFANYLTISHIKSVISGLYAIEKKLCENILNLCYNIAAAISQFELRQCKKGMERRG